MIEDQPTELCAEQSRQTGEPIFGTAPAETTIWLLLEYNQGWGAKAVENNDLPAPVQHWLERQLQTIPQSRLVFIKQTSAPLAQINFFVARVDETEQKLYHQTLTAYEDLLALDLNPYLTGSPSVAPFQVDTSLLLVCTNGKRDRCCSKFGLPLVAQLTEAAAPDQVWQSSHLGGHRWSPVVAVFPQGVYYRLLDPEREIHLLLQAVGENRIMLDGYRGRNCYSGPVQAAEYFIRRQTGRTDLDSFLLSDSCLEGGIWQVTFVDQAGKKKYHIRLVVEEEEPVLIGCTMGKSKVEPRYRLLSSQID